MTVGGMRMGAPQQEASEEGVRGWRMAGTKVEALHLEEVQRVEGLVVGEGEEDGVDEVAGGEEVVLEGNRQKMEVRKRGQVVVLVDVVVVLDEDGTEKTMKVVVVLVDVAVVLDEDGTEKTTKMAVVVLVDVAVVLDEDGTGKTTKMAVVVLVDVVVEGEVVLGENFQKKMEVRKRDQVVVVLVDVAGEGSGEAAEGIVKVTMRMERKLKVGTDRQCCRF